MTPGLILGEQEKFLLYGDYGTGKTFAALTAPEPIYALGVGGTNEFKTVYSKQFIEKVGRREIFFDAVKETRGEFGAITDNPDGLDNVKSVVEAAVERDIKEGLGIQSIVVDNATVLEDYMMNKAIAAEFAIMGGGDKAVLVREREWGIRKPQDTTWNGAMSLMSQFSSWLFELPYHIILVCHERKEFTKDDGGKGRSQKLIGVGPIFVGQQRTLIPNKFDNVWRMTVSGGGRSKQFQAQTVGDAIVAAKVRVGGFLDPNAERDINLTDVIAQFKQHAASLEANSQ